MGPLLRRACPYKQNNLPQGGWRNTLSMVALVERHKEYSMVGAFSHYAVQFLLFPVVLVAPLQCRVHVDLLVR